MNQKKLPLLFVAASLTLIIASNSISAAGNPSGTTPGTAGRMKLLSKEVFIRHQNKRPPATGFIAYVHRTKLVLMHCQGWLLLSGGDAVMTSVNPPFHGLHSRNSGWRQPAVSPTGTRREVRPARRLRLKAELRSALQDASAQDGALEGPEGFGVRRGSSGSGAFNTAAWLTIPTYGQNIKDALREPGSDRTTRPF